MAKICENFDLRITNLGEGAQAQYYIEVSSSPVGSMVEPQPLHLPFPLQQLRQPLLSQADDARGVKLISGPDNSSQPFDPQAFGTQLYDMIFTGDILALFDDSLAYVRGQDGWLRIRLLLVAVPELANLPWEYLYRADRKQFLAIAQDTPIIRYHRPRQRQPQPRFTPPLRILTVIANPSDAIYPRLDVEREWQKLEHSLAGLVQPGKARLDRLPSGEGSTLVTLRTWLHMHEVHVLHYIGHGYFQADLGADNSQDIGGLVLEDQRGQGELVSASRLVNIFNDSKQLPRLIFLNSCLGAKGTDNDPFAGVAQSLVQRGVPTVLAMQYAVRDDTAIVLAQEFYQCVADGLPMERALVDARLSVQAKAGNAVEWGAPVLYSYLDDLSVFPQPDPDYDSSRGNLLERVRQQWIADKLAGEIALHEHFAPGHTLLKLNKVSQPTLVTAHVESADPALFRAEIEQSEERTPDPDERIQAFFSTVGRDMSLLILGAAGSGKTLTLLTLLQWALDETERDVHEPMPVLLNLGEWEIGLRLEEWIIERLLDAPYYGLKDKARAWLQQNALWLFLDGLDMLTPESQLACVEAINDFHAAYQPTRIVVACRLEEYKATAERQKLKLEGAIVLQDLTDEQLQAYLAEAGDRLAALKEGIERDPELREIARRPLMLRMMSIVLEKKPVGALATQPLARSAIFDSYIQRLLRTDKEPNNSVQNRQLLAWLRWLADRLSEHGQQVFYLEKLQPSWFSNVIHCWLYVFTSRMCVGFFGGLATGPLIGLGTGIYDGKDIGEFLWRGFAEGLAGALIGGVATGLLEGLWMAGVAMPTQVVAWVTARWERVRSATVGPQAVNISGADWPQAIVDFIFIWLVNIAAVIFGFLVLFGLSKSFIKPAPSLQKSLVFWLTEGAAVGTLVGLGFGLLFGFRRQGIRRRWDRDIKTIELIMWRYNGAPIGIFTGLLMGILVAAVIGFGFPEATMVDYPIWERAADIPWIQNLYQFGEDERWTTFWALTLLAAPVMALIGGVMTGINRTHQTTDKLFLNEGISLSVKNAWLFATRFGPVFIGYGVFLGLLLGVKPTAAGYNIHWSVVWMYPLYAFFIVMLLIFWYGGIEVLLHYPLRFLLAITARIPLRFNTFLPYVGRLGLLTRSGGGYQFSHQLLQEHFKQIDPAKLAPDQPIVYDLIITALGTTPTQVFNVLNQAYGFQEDALAALASNQRNIVASASPWPVADKMRAGLEAAGATVEVYEVNH